MKWKSVSVIGLLFGEKVMFLAVQPSISRDRVVRVGVEGMGEKVEKWQKQKERETPFSVMVSDHPLPSDAPKRA